MSRIKHEIIALAPHTWCISEYKLVNAFLLEGTDRAALIDTGCGIGDIAESVAELTDKPVTIFLTHGHPDHSGGIYRFSKVPVYMHPADGTITEQFPCTNEMRGFYVQTRVPVRFPGEGNVEALMAQLPTEEPETQFAWSPLADGDEFDLGGRILKVIHTPGHSDGSVCYLDETTRTLFSGDTVNHNIILMRQPDNAPTLIRMYQESVAKLWQWQNAYDNLAIGHDGTVIANAIVKNYLDLTTGLLDGSITGNYEESGIRKGDVARLGMAELWYQCDQ